MVLALQLIQNSAYLFYNIYHMAVAVILYCKIANPCMVNSKRLADAWSTAEPKYTKKGSRALKLQKFAQSWIGQAGHSGQCRISMAT